MVLPDGVSKWDYIFEGRKEPLASVNAGVQGTTIRELVEKFSAQLGPPLISEVFAKLQRMYLRCFTRFLDDPTVEVPERAEDWTNKEINLYRSWRLGKKGRNKRKQPVRIITVDKEVGTFRRMFDFGMEEGAVTHNPVHNLKAIPDDSPDEEWLTSEEIDARIKTGSLFEEDAATLRRRLILDAVEVEELKDLCWQTSNRHYIDRPGDVALMINLAADLGPRIDEVFRLEKKDVVLDLANGKGSVTFRSRKQSRKNVWTSRTIPVSGALLQRLATWMAQTPGTRLFVDMQSNSLRNRLYTVLDRVTAGSPFHGLRPHQLRHACRTNWYEGKMDEPMIDHYLGHTTKAMGDRYRHLREKRCESQLLQYRQEVEAEHARRCNKEDGGGVPVVGSLCPTSEQETDDLASIGFDYRLIG